jgi:hypothetical protein
MEWKGDRLDPTRYPKLGYTITEYTLMTIDTTTEKKRPVPGDREEIEAGEAGRRPVAGRGG